MRKIVGIILHIVTGLICCFILVYPMLFLLRYDSQKIYYMLGAGLMAIVFFISDFLLDLIDRIIDKFDKY